MDSGVRRQIRHVTLLLGAGALALAVACGGGAADDTAATEPAATATTVESTATSTASSTETSDLVAEGKEIYATAGGVGCVSCHGLTGKGDGVSGVGAPNIRSATKAQIQGALAGGVPLMSFISLTPAEIDAVLAYIQTFGTTAP